MVTFFSSSLVFHLQNILIFGLLLIGVYYRRQRQKHTKIMLSAILWDFLLIVQIELLRGAIIKAARPLGNAAILNIHIALATTTVLFYIVMLYSGRRILRGDFKFRPKHKKFGMITLAFRTATLITSFWAMP